MEIQGGQSTGGTETSVAEVRWLRQQRTPSAALKAGGVTIVAVTLIASAAGFLASLLLKPTYEAVATVRLVQSKVPAPEGLSGNVRGETLNIPAARALVETQALVERIIKDFKLDSSPERLTRTSFLRRIRTEQVPGTSLLRIKVRMHDPSLAAAVANRIAELVVQVSLELHQQETRDARNLIKTQLDDVARRLEQTRRNLVAFRQKAQVELLKSDIEARLREREGLLHLRLEIEAHRARLARAQAELAKTDPFVTVLRAIDRDSALFEALRQSEGTVPLGLQLREQQPNPVYELLQEEIARTQTELASLEKELSEAAGRFGLDESRSPQLERLYEREASLAALQGEHDLLMKAYSDLAEQYEIAQLQVASVSSQLQVFDSALPPAQPVSPRPALTATAAGIFGFLLTSAFVLTRALSRPPV